MGHSYGVDPDLSEEEAARLRTAVEGLRAERRPLTVLRRFAEYDAALQANLLESLRQRRDRWRGLSWSARLAGLLCVVLAWLASGAGSGVGVLEGLLLAVGVLLFLAGIVGGFRGGAYRRTFSAATLDGVAPETVELIRRNAERRARG
ncbi:hypothetical protein [Rothia halotolerans]|uniref:hypothetical protein n=1 Tax=Rothia halotolerans TaxID=405770 RepID=UPI00101BB5A9|nr:hypothetical protein [Rothia halotolerans]